MGQFLEPPTIEFVGLHRWGKFLLSATFSSQQVLGSIDIIGLAGGRIDNLANR